MTTIAAPATELGSSRRPVGASRLSVVLCGSFRRDREGLRRSFESLGRLYEVISPTSVDFLDTGEFVRLADELEEAPEQIERRHLEKLRSADFVWLFCPHGYVGSSAALEVGYAQAAGVPIFSSESPSDPIVAMAVEVVPDPEEVAGAISPTPGEAIAALQHYYSRVAARRGWDGESARDTLLLLTEEIGELARAVRLFSGLARDGEEGDTRLEEELADVQLYLVHLANALGVDLSRAVTQKEQVNESRFRRRRSSAA